MLAMALNSIGVEAKSYTGRQVGIKTDSAFTKARIEAIDTDVMTADLDAGRVIVVAGFQGFDAMAIPQHLVVVVQIRQV
jgi:aspartate kinase